MADTSNQAISSVWSKRDQLPAETLQSILSQVSLGPLLSSSSRISGQDWLPKDIQDADSTATALSLFVLEVCSRQLRQYHLSTLEDATVLLNVGQGLDYSVDVSKTDDGELVVVKHCKIDPAAQAWVGTGRSPECARIWRVLEEIQIMIHPPVAHCENVLSLKGFGWEYVDGRTTTPSLVVEFANQGTLRQYLKTGIEKSDAEKLGIVQGVAQGILCLQDCGIIHGDIKMENILIAASVNGQFSPKVADFGNSIIMTSDKKVHPYWGTDIYNPPEVRRLGIGQAGALIPREELAYCDVWSFGLLALEVALDGECYADDELSLILQSANMEGIQASCLRRFDMSRLDDPETKSRFRNVICNALDERPKERRKFRSITIILGGEEISTQTLARDNELFNRQYDASNSIIDLSHSITMRAILKGRGTATFTPEKLPWSIQTEVVKRYQSLAELEDRFASGFAHLNLAICYYLGLGVERDDTKLCEHIHASALNGTPEARLVICQLSKALGFQLRTEELNRVKDPEFDDELAILLLAANQTRYRPPFRELLHHRSQNLVKLQIQPIDLHIAVALNDFEAVKLFLQSGLTDSQNDQGQTAFLLACQNGNLNLATFLLEGGSDPSLADDKGYTPLHMLIMFSDDSIGQLCSLIAASEKSVNLEAFSYAASPLPDFWDDLIGTPLQWAVTACNLAAVKALLSLGASPTSAQAWFSPIQIASSLFLYEILDILLKSLTANALDIEANGIFFLNEAHPFRQIMIHGDALPTAISRTVQRLSVVQGVDITAGWGTTPLMKTALTNISSTDVLIARELLKYSDISKDGPQFSTIQAGILGCNGTPSKSLPKITLMLIEAGFSPRAISSKEGSWPGWNAMHWAVAGQNYEIVEALMHKDPELLRIPTDYETKDLPLHIAAQASYGLEMVKLLLKLGADPCAEAGYGQTALSNCIGEFRLQLDMERFELLLKANAVNGYVVQGGGNTILHLAALRAARLDMEELPGHELLRSLLQRAEIRVLVNTKNVNGITPLHLVCYRPDYTSVRLLVESGADVNCMTPEPNGMSPIGITLEYARAPEPGWTDKDLDFVWHKAAFRAACYLSEKMARTPQDKKLSRLHIAAYCSYVNEVKRLVEEENADLGSRNAKGLTPREMLAGLLLLYLQTQTPIDPRYLARAKEILNYLNDRHQEQENQVQV